MNISVQREHCAARSLQASGLVVAAALAGCGGGGSSSHASSIPGGPTVAVTSHAARGTPAFMDSLGVNIHIGATAYPLASAGQIGGLVTALGIAHVRDRAYLAGRLPIAVTDSSVQLVALLPA